MFGYLNLGNPKLIGDSESQEMKNCRIDQGWLEYAQFETNSTNGRRDVLPNGKIVELSGNPLGQVKWRKATDTALSQIGLDNPGSIIVNPITFATVNRTPTLGTGAYASNPYAPGTYQYVVTLYDPDSGEESMPATYPDTVIVDHGTPGNEVAQFTLFPRVDDLFPGRPNLQWRIYRMPIGGSEFLLVNDATVISANSDYAGPYQDVTEDQNLGVICDSLDNGVVPLRTVYSSAFILYNDMLFIGGSSGETSRIFFSKQGEWWAFPPENEINFPGRFSSFCKFGETLLLLGRDGCHVLYGDNAENFAKKPIDFDISTGEDWVGANTARALNGLSIFSIEEDAVIEGDATTAINKLVAFDGAKVRNLTDNIQGLFPLAPPIAVNCPNAIIDNRYYAIKLVNVAATIAALKAEGRDLNTATEADYIYITLVFDSYRFGWITADDSGQFSYRTKEFSLPRKVQFHKTLWVQAIGEFVVEFLGDDNVVTSRSFNFTKKTKRYYTVKPKRYDSFSFRFIGQPGCKIYDFGVDE